MVSVMIIVKLVLLVKCVGMLSVVSCLLVGLLRLVFE